MRFSQTYFCADQEYMYRSSVRRILRFSMIWSNGVYWYDRSSIWNIKIQREELCKTVHDDYGSGV